MKKLLIIFLSCMLLVPSFGSFFVYTSFKLNQEEISKTICVQRKMVFNSCNGRCELQKSLKKYDDNEKKMENNLKEKAEIVYITTPIVNFKPIEPIQNRVHFYTVFDNRTVSVSIETFRPPSLI